MKLFLKMLNNLVGEKARLALALMIMKPSNFAIG